MSEKKNRAKLGSLSAALFTAAALSGCTTAAEPEAKISTVGQSLAMQMGTDSQYMMQKLDLKSATLFPSAKIDLADPAQQRFVMNRLAAAGKTAENSPELFDRIQKSTQKALARAAQISKGGAVTNAEATDWCRNFINLGSEVKINSTTTQFKTTYPNVTCVNGAVYVYADVSTYNSNLAGTENILVQSAAGEDYSGGTNFTAVKTQPMLPAVLGRLNKTDSLIIAYDEAGTEQMTYSMVQTAMVPIPGTITLQHPVLHPWIVNGGQIQMCQLRGLPTQCDYGVGQLAGSAFGPWLAGTTGIAPVAVGTGGTNAAAWAGDVANYFSFTTPFNTSHIYMPTQGTFDVGATATGVCGITSITKAEFRLVKTVDGGTCTTTSNFAGGITFTPGSRTGTFKLISDFVNDGGTGAMGAVCTQAAVINEGLKGVISIQAMANCGGPSPVPRFLNFGPDGASPALQPYIYFLNSCFAEGTPIRRADGKTVAIQDVKSGDKIISDNKGTVLTVTGVSNGLEDEPLVALRDDKGHSIKLTSKHPMVTADGAVVFASALKKNDKVMTDRGVATIVSATRVPVKADTQVYSLSVGTEAEKAKVGKDGTTVFAGGFLAGDAAMQKAHEAKTRNVAQLSPAWGRDYKNASMNNPPMQRVLR